MAALLFRRQLVLEVHRRGAGLDHGLHQLEDVERAAEAGFGIGDDRDEEVEVAGGDAVGLLHRLDLVGALQRLVDATDDRWNAVDRVEALVWVHVARRVGVGRDLPAAQVDGLEAGLDLLHGLVAGEGAEGGHEVFGAQQFPQAPGAVLGEGLADLHRAGEPAHIGRRVGAGDVLPAVGSVVGGRELFRIGGLVEHFGVLWMSLIVPRACRAGCWVGGLCGLGWE